MRISYSILLLVACSNLTAQNLNFDVSGAGIGANGVVRFNDPSLMGEKSGAKIDYSDIRGNCFLDEKWSPVLLRLKSKAMLRFSKFKLNLYTNDIHYIDKSGIELVASSKLVDDIFIFNQIDTARLTFKLKKFTLDGNEGFFLLLNTGKVQLLKRTSVTLFKGDYDVSRGKNDFRFVRKNEYFLMNEGKINPLLDLSKDSLKTQLIFSDVQLNWLKTKKNKLKKEIEVVQFLDFYNSTEN